MNDIGAGRARQNVIPRIYDFGLFPYALGDVLTWNVRSAISAVEAGVQLCDTHLCMEKDSAVPFFQKSLIRPENAFLHFSELLPAFTTHPMLRNTLIHASRHGMIDDIRADFANRPDVLTDLDEYQTAATTGNDDSANRYFSDQIHSHEVINDFYSRHGYIPQLTESWGCSLDMEYLLSWILQDRRVVVLHPRLRSLDRGMMGLESYWRDSDFVEWFDFIVTAGERHPEVMFVVVGRLQEKPLELLRLPNVMTLRALGYGLGHELTLIKWCDLFMGTSSGFAAMANFCEVPYYITRVSRQACETYGISYEDPHLPFATSEQVLTYGPETTDMLLSHLEEGLARSARGRAHSNQLRDDFGARMKAFLGAGPQGSVPVKSWSSTYRFFTHDSVADSELKKLLEQRLLHGDEENRILGAEGVGPEVARLVRLYPRYRATNRELGFLARGRRLPRGWRLRIRLRHYVAAVERRPLHLRHRMWALATASHLARPLRWTKRAIRKIARGGRAS